MLNTPSKPRAARPITDLPAMASLTQSSGPAKMHAKSARVTADSAAEPCTPFGLANPFGLALRRANSLFWGPAIWLYHSRLPYPRGRLRESLVDSSWIVWLRAAYVSPSVKPIFGAFGAYRFSKKARPSLLFPDNPRAIARASRARGQARGRPSLSLQARHLGVVSSPGARPVPWGGTSGRS